ncbi:hypothetical protein Bca4012_088690 [Brassica carinata]
MNVGAKPCHRSLSSLSSLFKSRIQKNVHRNTVLIQSELEVEVRRECKTGHLKLEKALLYFEKLVETRPMPLVDTFNHLLGSVMKLKGASEVISMYKRMKHHGVDPGLYTSNILINAFHHLEKIEYGFCVLSDVMKRGLEPDLVTVDSLSDVTLYGTIIGKLCGAGETGMAVDLHRRMIAAGYEGNVDTYGSFVKNKSIHEAMAVFGEMQVNGVSPNVLSFGMIIHGCRLIDATKLFETMRHEEIELNVVTYNIMISGYCKYGKLEEAFELIREMNCKGLKADSYTCMSLIRFVNKAGDSEVAKEVIDVICKSDCSLNLHHYTALIDGLNKREKIDEARRLFDQILPDVVAYNSMIMGYFKFGKMMEAMELITRMRRDGMRPSGAIYTTLIRGASQAGNWDIALEIFDADGHALNVIQFNALIDGLIKSGRWDDAKRLFDEISDKGLVPDPITYNTMISGYCKHGKLEEATELIRRMKHEGLEPDSYTYTSLIHASCRAGDSDAAQDIFNAIRKSGQSPDIFQFNSLISGLIKNGKLDDAKRLFDEIQNMGLVAESKGCSPDSVMFNTVITGFLQLNKVKDAVPLLESMLDRKFTPDSGVKHILRRVLARPDGRKALQPLLDTYGENIFE